MRRCCEVKHNFHFVRSLSMVNTCSTSCQNASPLPSTSRTQLCSALSEFSTSFHNAPLSSSSNILPAHPTETRIQPPSPSAVYTPPHKYPTDNPRRPSPSHLALLSKPSTHPRGSGSASRQSQLGTRRLRGWRRERPLKCASAGVSGSALCGIG